MGSWRWWGAVTHSLGWRLVITLTGSLLLLLGVSGWLALQLHRQHLYSLLERTAIELGETILSSTRSSMMENDRNHLDEIIQNIGSRESVLALRLVNAGGEVEYSNHPQEVGRIHALDSPVCQGCHFGETVHIPVNLREGLRRVPADGGETALALGFPVMNSPGCSAASCHVHPASQQVLGILDLELSAAPLEGAISDAASQMLAFGIITVVVVAAVIALVGWRMVHRPVQAMLKGVRRLATGDLATRLTVGGPTELKELALSVNLMSQQLQTQSRELEEWNRTLETRIAEKTEQLERTRDQMVFAEKMSSLGKLAAIVAHEINNPLAGILVSAKWLRRRVAKIASASPDGPAAEVAQLDESLAMVESETARCGDVVRNLLLFSHRGDPGFEAVEANALLERAVRLIRHRAEMEEVEIRFALDENLPRIQGSAAEIQQAILAILINGLEAMDDGGELRIATRPANGGIVIEIADNGCGIPEHLRARIFEPFFSTKEVGNATGLGLTVVYGIVERHGGRIDVESGEKGTTFRIFLPDQPPPYPDTLPDLLRSASLG